MTTAVSGDGEDDGEDEAGGGYPADLYAAVHDGTPGDRAFYRAQCTGARRVLELGCGHGRLLGELADVADEVVGLEIDPSLRAMAERRVAGLPPAVGSRIRIVAGDMRHFDLGSAFDRILVPYTGLYCLLSARDVGACLRTIARHLVPGGRLVLDAYDADGFHTDADEEDLDDDALLPVCEIDARGTRWQVLERSHWDRRAQIIDSTYVHVAASGDAVHGRIRQRYLLKAQLRAALRRAGFEDIRIEAGFGGAEPDHVWSALATAPRCADPDRVL